jgi:hypothetical protein
MNLPSSGDKKPTGGAFAIGYDVAQPGCGTCEAGEIGAVYIEVNGDPQCGDCWENSGSLDLPALRTVRYLANALDDIDSALFHAPEGMGGWMLSAALDTVMFSGAERVEAGRDGPMPDADFVDELIRRRPDSMDREDLWRLVGLLAPDLTAEDTTRMAAAAEARHVQATTQIVAMDAALLVMARAGAGPGSPITVGEAVEKVGIDFDRFQATLTTVCAELGVGPRDLPPDVVNDVIATSRKEVAVDPDAPLDPAAFLRAKGLDEARIAEILPDFEEKVRQAYVREHGHEPPTEVREGPQSRHGEATR